MSNEAARILANARSILRTAEAGLEQLLQAHGDQRISGLHNVVVFGRSVTFVLQKLVTPLGDEFTQWYEERQQRMRQDPLLRYFKELRNRIEKEGETDVAGASTHIRMLGPAEMQRLMADPPPGAAGFFIGDQLGGSGWTVPLDGGGEEKYYVELPADIGQTRLQFDSPPQEHRGVSLADTSVEALAAHYLAYLRELLDEAEQRFAQT